MERVQIEAIRFDAMWRKLMVVGAIAIGASAVVDSAGAEPSTGALPPDVVDVVSIAGRFGVPADASMVAATVTAIDPGAAGWIKAYPCDAGEPDTANLNYVAGEIANNLVLARLSPAGKLCIATRSISDYVIDLAGFVPAGSDLAALDTPTRVLDTRSSSGNPSPLPDGTTLTLQLGGKHGIPEEAGIAVFNLTAVGGPNAGRVTAHPCDEAPGTTSSVNFPADRNVPNLVVSRLAADGTVCFLNKNEVDIVVDVAAYASDGITTLPTPVRIADTRDDAGLLAAGTTTVVDPELPDDARAAVFNLASVSAPSRGFAVAHPCDEQRPTASNLNYLGAGAASAGAFTKLAVDGTFCLYNRTETELIVDLVGYTSDASVYTPLTPLRIKDTRRCPVLVVPEVLQGSLNRPSYSYRVLNLQTGAIVHAEVGARVFDESPTGDLPSVTGDCASLVATGDFCCFDQRPVITTELYGPTTSAQGLTFTPTALLDDGRFVIAGADRVIDASTGDDIAVIDSSLEGGRARISRNGQWLAILERSEATQREIEVWSVDRAELLYRLPIDQSTVRFDISDDGRHLVFDSEEVIPEEVGHGGFVVSTLRVVGASGEEVLRLTEQGQFQALQFSGRGTIVACMLGSTGSDASVVEFDLAGHSRQLEVLAGSELFDDDPFFWREQCEQMVVG